MGDDKTKTLYGVYQEATEHARTYISSKDKSKDKSHLDDAINNFQTVVRSIDSSQPPEWQDIKVKSYLSNAICKIEREKPVDYNSAMEDLKQAKQIIDTPSIELIPLKKQFYLTHIGIARLLMERKKYDDALKHLKIVQNEEAGNEIKIQADGMVNYMLELIKADSQYH